MNTQGAKILIVEDESSVRKFLLHSLEANGFRVEEAATGGEGLEKVVSFRPAVVILDFGLPDITGLEVMKRLREWTKIPIIFLTARDSPEDKVAALDGGADDYLTKPFSVSELLARVRVALRHAQVEPNAATPIFRSGVLEFDLVGHEVKLGGKEVKLSATEYQLLGILVKQAGKVVPHRFILKEVWGPNSVEHHHYLRVYFGMIRKKLEAACPGSGAMIENESGIGYRLRA